MLLPSPTDVPRSGDAPGPGLAGAREVSGPRREAPCALTDREGRGENEGGSTAAPIGTVRWPGPCRAGRRPGAAPPRRTAPGRATPRPASAPPRRTGLSGPSAPPVHRPDAPPGRHVVVAPAAGATQRGLGIAPASDQARWVPGPMMGVPVPPWVGGYRVCASEGAASAGGPSRLCRRRTASRVWGGS